uniref:Uncharacterized protein n=1 Tax=Panagrolaimus sp. JU765 TaxID=591449 RepID=A0AC34RQ83_9BILA
MCQIFVLLLLLFSINGGLSSSVDDVKTMMDEFSQLSEPTTDDVEFLEKISSKSDKFFRLARPIAALVASSMNINFQPDSDEYEAIELLQSKITEQFETMEMRLQQYRKRPGIFLPNGYGESVFIKLNSLQFKFDLNVDPSTHPEDKKRNLYNICTNYSPLEILIFLERVLIGGCPLPTEEDINVYVRTRQAFRLLESHWKGMRICMLQYAHAKNNFIRDTLSALVKQLGTDLLETEFFGTFCANIVWSRSPSGSEAYLQALKAKIEKLSNHTAKWIQVSQDFLWRKIMVEEVKNILSNLSEPLPDDKFNETAVKLQKEFEIRGSPIFSYQILLAKALKDPVNCAVKTASPENYTSILDFNGLNVHVFRYAKGQIERAKNASEWFDYNYADFRWGIDDYKFKGATKILSVLEEQMGGTIVSTDLYSSVVVLWNGIIYSDPMDLSIGKADWSQFGVNRTHERRQRAISHVYDAVYIHDDEFFGFSQMNTSTKGVFLTHELTMGSFNPSLTRMKLKRDDNC